jgi:hypothetical protein
VRSYELTLRSIQAIPQHLRLRCANRLFFGHRGGVDRTHQQGYVIGDSLDPIPELDLNSH